MTPRTESDPRLPPWIPRAGLPEATVGVRSSSRLHLSAAPQGQSAELRAALAEGVIHRDIRLPSTLKAAGVQQARSVLILSSDNTINLKTALQVRLPNNNATVVVHSSSQQGDLNLLLESRIANLITVDPQLLTAVEIAQSMRKEAHPETFRVDRARILLSRHRSPRVT